MKRAPPLGWSPAGALITHSLVAAKHHLVLRKDKFGALSLHHL